MAKKKIGAGRASKGLGVFRDHEMEWVFMRTLTYMGEKAAEIGDCLYAVCNINEKDPESWIETWAQLGARVERQAQESLAIGDRISAREGFLRASNYYRTAEYGCTPSHARFYELWEKSVVTFRQACPLFETPVEVVEIPFEGCLLPGYYWQPDKSNKPRPTLMAVGGNDSSGEEIFFSTGPGAVRHGYNYFTFEYPGHRGAVHLNPNCVKRPDYEIPFAAALDFLQQLPGVDERIALAGFSFGGYVASRVAIHEPRIKALIPDSPIIDLPRLVTGGFFAPLIKGVPRGLLDRILAMRLQRAPMVQALIEYSLWTWGFSSFSEELDSETFNACIIRDDLHRIKCPALVLVGEEEGEMMIRQAQDFYDGIGSQEKEMHILSMVEDGSADHCQLDNIARAHQIIFPWLDRIFQHSDPSPPVIAS